MMVAQPLPYDMGNAGDLLKHGILAEFTQWWCKTHSKSIRFIDPFGGRPWAEPPVPLVTDRVKSLRGFALFEAQPKPEMRYYGSGHIVRNAARAVGQDADVLVSDRDTMSLQALIKSGLSALRYPGFDPINGFSIVSTDIEADLVLIDPYATFLRDEAPQVIPQAAKASTRMAIVLFVLNLNPRNAVGQRYAALKRDHLPNAWTMHCPKLRSTGVRGESNYEAEVLLSSSDLNANPLAIELQAKLEKYAQKLTEVLGTHILFSAGA